MNEFDLTPTATAKRFAVQPDYYAIQYAEENRNEEIKLIPVQPSDYAMQYINYPRDEEEALWQFTKMVVPTAFCGFCVCIHFVWIKKFNIFVKMIFLNFWLFFVTNV